MKTRAFELSSHIETALPTLEFCYDVEAYEAMIAEKTKQVRQEPLHDIVSLLCKTVTLLISLFQTFSNTVILELVRLTCLN